MAFFLVATPKQIPVAVFPCVAGLPSPPPFSGMASDGLFLATRHPTIPSARRVFSLVGRDAASPADLRAHLLRPWPLRVKLFQCKDTANLWSAEDAGGCAAGAPPAPPPHSFEEGSILRLVSRAGDSLYDLADTTSAASFLIAAGTSTCAAGVQVQGVALTPDAGLEDDPVVTKRPRIEVLAEGPKAGAGALPPVNPLSTAAATAVEGDAGTPPTLESGGGRAVRRGQRSMPRPVVSWSYAAPYKAADDCEDSYRSRLLKVATARNDWELGVGLTGEARRTCELLVDVAGVFLTGPPGSGKTHMVNQVISGLRDAGLNVAACGSSGVAAALVNGTTVHSWAGFVNGDADMGTPLGMVLRKVIPMAAKVRMCAAMALVVDEIGTLSAALLTRLDLVLRAVRRSASPFGGLRVLFVGDFLQLAPPKGQYAFCSDVWRAVFGDRAVVLTTHWRHVRDSCWASSCACARANTLRPTWTSLRPVGLFPRLHKSCGCFATPLTC